MYLPGGLAPRPDIFGCPKEAKKPICTPIKICVYVYVWTLKITSCLKKVSMIEFSNCELCPITICFVPEPDLKLTAIAHLFLQRKTHQA